MRKHFSYLIAVLFLASMTQVNAENYANVAGYNPGVYNATEVQNLRNFEIDKSYVQSLDDVFFLQMDCKPQADGKRFKLGGQRCNRPGTFDRGQGKTIG